MVAWSGIVERQITQNFKIIRHKAKKYVHRTFEAASCGWETTKSKNTRLTMVKRTLMEKKLTLCFRPSKPIRQFEELRPIFFSIFDFSKNLPKPVSVCTTKSTMQIGRGEGEGGGYLLKSGEH